MEEKVNYEINALEYAMDNGIISYDVEGNVMSYEEQVQDGLNKYGIYKAEVNLDTMKVTRKKAENK